MRLRTALVGLLLSAQLTSIGAQILDKLPLLHESGKAYVTQAGTVAGNHESELSFGSDWNSVRLFRLTRPLSAPLKVYVETHPSNPSLFQAHYRDYVNQSLQAWSNALDGRLSYVYTTERKGADITVDWVPTFDDHYVAGVTDYSIGHAAVQIKTIGIPDKDIKANIIHEFGHALGIAGHSGNQEDIMVGMRRWHRGKDADAYEPKLSRHDVQAIRLLYSAQWKKGEDLYSADAQNTQVIADNNGVIPANLNRMPQVPAQQSAVLVWNQGQKQLPPVPISNYQRVYQGTP